MNFDAPIFISLHSVGVEGMINVHNINAVAPYNDTITHIYMNRREEPMCVDESYEEIKKKLLNVGIIL